MCKKTLLLTSFVMVLCLVLTSAAKADLIGWWRLDDGSGTRAEDSSGAGNHGTLQGNPQWVEGIIGGALDLDGNDDFVEINGIADDLKENNFSVSAWIKTTMTGDGNVIGSNDSGSGHDFIWGVIDGNLLVEADSLRQYPAKLNDGEWHFIAYVRDGSTAYNYIEGVLVGTETPSGNPAGQVRWSIGQEWDSSPSDEYDGVVDDVHFFNNPLTEDEIQRVMVGSGFPLASRPDPADGSVVNDTWVSLSWKAGDFAVSHDVYFGEILDDVNNGTGGTFRGNQTSNFYIVGFPGYPYPDGLVPGTTYYWRIDEVNTAEPNSPWKGKIWSFTIRPRIAHNPNPANGAESVRVDVTLSWTAGLGAKLHTVYFGDDFDTVANAKGGMPQGTASYKPATPLKMAKTYYWRVDEFDAVATYKGDVWSFTTQGAVGGPNPANGAVDVKPTAILRWRAGALAASHEVYFGSNADAVKNATKTSSEYKGPKALGDESYNPGKLLLETTYYWRIDEVNTVNPDSPWKGNVWSFTTGDFFVIDDFEDYTDNDAAGQAIWQTWVDGFNVPDNGAQCGNLLPPYAERTIVHSGTQSMPFYYNNTGGVRNSEVSLAMKVQRNWTEEGVGQLSLWFRGNPASVGSFVEAPAGTYTLTATGADIWNLADQFHFAFKTLAGVGSIEAQVLSVDNTDPWAKAGVMIRETLEPGSKFAAVYITPGNGCRFQARVTTNAAATSDSGVVTTQQTAIKAPYWVKLERDVAGNFRGYYSANGTTWTTMSWNPQSIVMGSNVYVGLALTSHNNAATCTAKFSNVRTTGTVGVQWANQDIGIASNAAEPLYVAVSNTAGQPAIVVHPDATAATITTWTEWVIPLQTFADKGINLANVDKFAIGMGSKGNATATGGAGTMYIDDIRLNRPSAAP